MLQRLALSFGLISVPLSAADSVPEPLQQLLGCFKVTFNYIEDGENDAFFSPVYEEGTLAAASPWTIQRELIVDGIRQPHWKEIWEAGADEVWTQTVYGPFGDFRYTCSATWNLNQWSCVAPKAAKPRRDKDRPYAYLERGNTLQINAQRWVHVQLNKKRRADDSLYSVEAGWNTYERVDASHCRKNSAPASL